MNILVCGSRTFNDYNEMLNKLKSIVKPNDTIISGGAVGADSYAVLFAKEFNINYTIIKPKWSLYGKSAGFKRNIEMLDMLNTNDLVVAFIVNDSQGSMHTVKNAEQRGIKTIVYNYKK